MVERIHDARPGSRWRRWDTIANAVLIVGVAAAMAIPVLLCAWGWREGQVLRGLGADGGEFTVAACGDKQKVTTADAHGDEQTSFFYTCTGTFAAVASKGLASPVHASVRSRSSYRDGARTRARIDGDGAVRLASTSDAAANMGAMVTLACIAAAAEGAALWRLDRRIRRGLPIAVFDGDWGGYLFGGLIGLIMAAPIVFLCWGLTSLCFSLVYG